jgi:hypothetical protein
LAGSHGDKVGQSLECGAAVGAPLDLVFQTAAERLSAMYFIMFKIKPENRQGTAVVFPNSVDSAVVAAN